MAVDRNECCEQPGILAGNPVAAEKLAEFFHCCDGGVQFLRKLAHDLSFPLRSEESFGCEVLLHVGERIARRAPSIGTFGATAGSGVDPGFARRTIGLALHQYRAAAPSDTLEAFVGYPVDGHNIVAIHGDGGYAGIPRLECEVVHSAARREAGRICPGIILYHKNDGQVLGGGKVDRFVPATKRGSRLGCKSNHDVAIVLPLVN